MRIACWITKAINTHSYYVILIAFSRQKWLHERASKLRLYVHCLSSGTCIKYVLNSGMKRIKRAILVKDFSAELHIIIASYNIVPIYTLHICHIQRLMKRKCLNVRPLYRSASHQHYKTCGIILPFIIACIKPTYLKKTLQISWDTKFTVKLKEAILCTIIIISYWDLNKYSWVCFWYIIYYTCLICETIF